MTPREWAALGFRLLAIYLFIDALFWSGATLIAATMWWFEEPQVFDSPPMKAYGGIVSLVKVLQALAAGYWLWYGARRLSKPVRCGAGLQSCGEHLSPFMVLAIATWGGLQLIPALGQLLNLLIAAQW